MREGNTTTKRAATITAELENYILVTTEDGAEALVRYWAVPAAAAIGSPVVLVETYGPAGSWHAGGATIPAKVIDRYVEVPSRSPQAAA